MTDNFQIYEGSRCIHALYHPNGEFKMVGLRTLQNLFTALMLSSLFIFSSITLAATDKSNAKLVETTKVAEGVYVFRWWVYRNLFVVTDEGVIATDPINPIAAKLLMQEIRKVTDKPIKYVVYSHQHWDHISGGEIFKEVGAQFVSHEGYIKHFKRRPSPAVVLPDITFSDKHTLTLGGKNLELEYFGKNHGDCLITMRLPEEKIIFLVDIVTPKRLAFRNMPDFLPDE